MCPWLIGETIRAITSVPNSASASSGLLSLRQDPVPTQNRSKPTPGVAYLRKGPDFLDRPRCPGAQPPRPLISQGPHQNHQVTSPNQIHFNQRRSNLCPLAKNAAISAMSAHAVEARNTSCKASKYTRRAISWTSGSRELSAVVEWRIEVMIF